MAVAESPPCRSAPCPPACSLVQPDPQRAAPVRASAGGQHARRAAAGPGGWCAAWLGRCQAGCRAGRAGWFVCPCEPAAAKSSIRPGSCRQRCCPGRPAGHAPCSTPLHSAPSAGPCTPAIARQLAALGGDHVGFASKRFPGLALTLLGGRPFSKGGRQWSDVAEFYARQFGVGSHADSAMRLLDVALQAPEGDVKVGRVGCVWWGCEDAGLLGCVCAGRLRRGAQTQTSGRQPAGWARRCCRRCPVPHVHARLSTCPRVRPPPTRLPHLTAGGGGAQRALRPGRPPLLHLRRGLGGAGGRPRRPRPQGGFGAEVGAVGCGLVAAWCKCGEALAKCVGCAWQLRRGQVQPAGQPFVSGAPRLQLCARTAPSGVPPHLAHRPPPALTRRRRWT